MTKSSTQPEPSSAPSAAGKSPVGNGSAASPPASLGAGAAPATGSSSLPAWCPAWAERLGDAYLSGTSCVFLLHGNVRDLVPVAAPVATGRPDPVDAWGTVPEFLAREMFGGWDIVLSYDVGKGLRPLAGADPARLRTMAEWLTGRLGNAAQWPREPDAAIAAIDAILERNLMDPPEQRKRIAVVLDYAQYLVPAGEAGARTGAARLVRVLGWATNPLLRRVNVAVVLVADTLSEIHPRLVTSAAITAIDVPMPTAAERERFALATAAAAGMPADQDASVRRMAAVSGGLTLDAVAGHEAAKSRLESDARAIRRGQFESAPMGYLICGPVGTGKSFISECYAGSVGIPCAVLKNFRSKYVGETEGNLEHALGVLRSLGPVVVVVDEADAALGNRESGGDSGTSARVFSMIARQMGDTRYRGKIVWMLLTSRPDLLPIDLKRQGRAEVHIPLFYPHDQAEMEAMFTVMARKAKVKLAPGLPGPVDLELGLSGADIESVVLAARRRGLERAADAGQPSPEEISADDLKAALDDFMPSAQGLEKELQEIVAVLECTEKRFLPERWRKEVDAPGGRSRLQERAAAIREVISS